MHEAIENWEPGLSELIKATGYRGARGRYMGLVVQCAIETLARAESQLKSEWDNFCRKDGALRDKTSTRGSTHKVPHENALTYELGDFVDAYLKSLPIDHRYRGQIHFHYEKPATSKKLAGSKRKRHDLRYEAYVPDGPELVIEAKPLISESDISRRYLGAEGLGRFTRHEEPATQELLGGLLGYVLDEDEAEWRSKLRSATSPGTEQIDVHLGTWSLGSFVSKHSRPTGHIWMLHLLLRYPRVV